MGTIVILERGVGLDRTVRSTFVLALLLHFHSSFSHTHSLPPLHFDLSALETSGPSSRRLCRRDSRSSAFSLRRSSLSSRRVRVPAAHTKLLVFCHHQRVGRNEHAPPHGRFPNARRRAQLLQTTSAIPMWQDKHVQSRYQAHSCRVMLIVLTPSVSFKFTTHCDPSNSLSKWRAAELVKLLLLLLRIPRGLLLLLLLLRIAHGHSTHCHGHTTHGH